MTKCPSTMNPVSGWRCTRSRSCCANSPAVASLSLGHLKLREPPEDPSELRRLPHLLAQGIGPGVDLAHVRGPHPLRGPQQLPQGELERELALDALGALRQRRQQRERFPQGGDRFVMGIPPRGIVPRLLPIVDGPRDLAAALEVDGQLGRDLPRLGAIARLQAQCQCAGAIAVRRAVPSPSYSTCRYSAWVNR